MNAGKFALFVSPEATSTSAAQTYYRHFIKAKNKLYYEMQFSHHQQIKNIYLIEVALP